MSANILSNRFQKIAWEKESEENPVTDEDARAYYEDHPERFKGDAVVNAYEMVRPIPAHDEDVKYEVWKAQNEAREPLEEALKRLKEGESFQKLAKEYSLAPTAEKGGHMGDANELKSEERGGA